jgi:hypothetical protein
MAVVQPPAYMAGTYPPALLRAYPMLNWLQDPGSAVIRPFGAVIPRGGNLDMPVSQSASTVTIGPGAVVVPGTENAAQYGYLVINDADVAFTIPSAPASQTRRDLIVMRVRDSAYSGVDADADLVLVQGTPASSNPQLPVAPANSVIIAQVSTAGTAVPVASGAFAYTCAPGGIRPARGGVVDDEILPQFPGQYRDVDGVLQRGDASGGVWQPIGSVAPWDEATAALRNGSGDVGLGTGGQAKVRSQVFGKRAHLRYTFLFGTSPNGGSGFIYTQLPEGLTLHPTGVQRLTGVLRTAPSGDYVQTYDWPVYGYCDPATPNIFIVTPAVLESSILDYFRASGGANNQAVPYIPSGSPVAAGVTLDMSGVVELA